ncbi:MAG TPA: hypothetical protein VG456_01550 [Candidatus Sulfopaludibacter sp.]|jgi:hypothetical protein|nr:hypothetical protein [Candidatus Sulfopaludibacter sp.]
MLASLLIIGISLILFVYWFRYSCILLLRGAAEQIGDVVADPDTRFSVNDVQARLKAREALDPLHSALNRDYQVLTYLLHHAAGLELASFEDRLLVVDYRVMQVYYRATHKLFPEQARIALTEMASVLDVLVHKIGQQAGI